jgi:hypothetical protein
MYELVKQAYLVCWTPMNDQLIVLTHETSPLLDAVFYSETDILVIFLTQLLG